MKQGSTGEKHRLSWRDYPEESTEDQLSIIATSFMLELMDFVSEKYGEAEAIKVMTGADNIQMVEEFNINDIYINPGNMLKSVQDLIVKHGDTDHGQ